MTNHYVIGRVGTLIEQVILFADGFRLAAQLQLPARGGGPFPTLIVCHGLGSRAANHAEFAAFLARNGWAALTFDFRGHGASEGWLDEHVVNDVAAAAAYLQTRPEVDARRLVVRGSSMGGHFAIHAVASLPLLRGAVAICPAPEDVLLTALQDAGTWRSLRQGGLSFRLAVPDFMHYLERSNLSEAARTISPRALLLVHAKGDESIDYRRTVALYRDAADPKQLLLLEGGSHTSAQHDLATHEATLAWLEHNT